VKLPGGTAAIVPLRKLADYALSPSHAKGRHKARLFKALFGMDREHAAELRAILLRAAVEEDAEFQEDVRGGRARRPSLP
jgi:hypothetical protein